MSIDHSSSLTIGFFFTDEELEKPYQQHLEEVWHHEVRFDTITGQPSTVKIVDCKEDDYTLYRARTSREIPSS